MKSSVACFASFVVCSLVAFDVFQPGNAGKTINLPHYRVKFGTWPLMEVTKTGRSSHGRSPYHRGPKHIGGGGLHSAYRLGPPPTEDKGSLHQQLQANLKHYSKKPVNLNLPIIVKAPGPHPPPPPHGYKLGPPNGVTPNHVSPIKITDSSWKPGPPQPSNYEVSSLKGTTRSTRLMSMLKNAAISGIFKNGVDIYQSPEYLPGRPYPGPYNSIAPDGSQITTYLNEGVMSAPTNGAANAIPAAGIEAKPSIPPVLRIGDPLPDNYTVIYAERQIVGMKSPDTLENSGNPSPGTAQYDLGLNLGGDYEQGYGKKPPPRHPLVITKYQRRGDQHYHEEKLVDQELPDVGLLSTTNFVFRTPNISAPLGGRNSPLFKKALEEKQKILKHRKKEKPLDAQVKLLGRLFTKLQRLKPPKVSVPVDEVDPDSPVDTDDEDGWKKVAKSKVDSPIMAVQIQTVSVPDVDSTDPDIVESMAEFGTHDIEFGETDEIVNLMETVMNHGSSRVNLRDLGSNPQEINDNMLNWVRRHLALSREANQQVHSKGEEIANRQFRQYQTFVTPPFGSMGWGPSNPMPVDPKRGSRAIPIAMTHMAAGMNPRTNR